MSQRPPKDSEKLWEAFWGSSELCEGPLEAQWGPMAVSKLQYVLSKSYLKWRNVFRSLNLI